MNGYEYVDPTDLCGVNERLVDWAADGEEIHPVRIDQLVVADDAIDALVEIVNRYSGGGPVMMVVDPVAMVRDGVDLKALIEERLRRVGPLVVRVVVDSAEDGCGGGRDGIAGGGVGARDAGAGVNNAGGCGGSETGGREAGGSFHASMDWARRLAGEFLDCSVVVSVGSGSVTDAVKYGRHLVEAEGKRAAGDLKMVCFATAASVTAYTSALAVLSVDGVKRTLSTRAPDAVVCDLRTVACSPKAMTLAGFGDVLARSVAYGDWYLAGQLGMDEVFSLVPGRLLAFAEEDMIAKAEAVGAGELGALRVLTEGVLLAGMAMSIVNQTAPVSGWEHVMSHYLDLTAASDRRETALHGGQVGVATLVAARAYERAWDALDLDLVAGDVDVAGYRAVVEREFAGLGGGSEVAGVGMVEEIWRDLEKKLVRWNSVGDARRRFVERKKDGELDSFLRENVRPSADVAAALERAGAPRRFADLTEPIPGTTAFGAVMRSHLIRSRFTLGDLLSVGGWLNADRGSALLDEQGLG